ncbi:hypothetical protein [Desulfitobacterium sp. AusDCA]|uniref:hypothetical protein n=1 Tax=Desulfitobacterium sp. AusDCA TaxID=3240383 RepID=UPI003DA6DE0B
MKKALIIYSLIFCLSLLSGCKEKDVSVVKPNPISQPNALIETESDSPAAVLNSVSSTEAMWSKIEFKLTGNLPEGWRITFPFKNQGEIFKRDKQVGAIEVYGYEGESFGSGLPNHSSIVRAEEIKSGFGNGKLYTLERSEPAASKTPRTWNEYYAIFPIKGENLAYNVWVESDDLDNDLITMRSILQILGVNGEN